MKLDKNFKLSTTVKLSKIISSQIAKVKIYVMYEGRNRNHTHFSRKMIEEKLIPTMYGMPIVGEFKAEGEDFGDHGGKVTIQGDDVKYESTTVAYGFIPESAEIKWEEVEEKNGVSRDYLVSDAYVWYKRFPEVERILEEPRNQSMEIEIINAQWDEKLGAYDILDAEFAGACILGLNVEPCFESAKIGKFALEKMKFDLNEMAKELKEVIKDSEVKTEMENEKDLVVEETAVEETTKVVEEVAEEVAEESTEEVVEETAEIQATEEYAEVVETEEQSEEVSEESTVIETVQELVEEVAEVIETAPEGVDETVIQEAESAVQEVKQAVENLVEATENIEEEVETIEETTGDSLFQVNYEEENATLKAEIESLKEQMAEMQTEVNEYRALKLEQELASKNEIVESFTSELTEEELAPIRENLETLSNEEVETKLFALLGKKKMNFSANKADSNKAIVFSSLNHEDDQLPSWARAIEQTLRK